MRDDSTWLGRIISFIVGGAFGVIVGAWVVASFSVYEPRLAVAVIAACAVVSGRLAARYGWRFWEAPRHLRWFGP